MFCSAQDSSVWLELTSREQLMSLECSKYQVLSLAKRGIPYSGTFYSMCCQSSTFSYR